MAVTASYEKKRSQNDRFFTPLDSEYEHLNAHCVCPLERGTIYKE